MARLALLTALLLARVASGADLSVNPGHFGPNALPPRAGEPPAAPDRLVVRVEAIGQRAGAGDLSLVPAFRIEAPFGRWVTLLSEGRPVEFWSVTRATQDTWGLGRGQGITKGDVSFGARFLCLDGGVRWPSIGVRTLTKTTTGKGFDERRFTNAPAYSLDLLFSQRIGALAGGVLEAWAMAGFFGWQQGSNGQNDSFEWSGTLAWRSAGGSRATLEARGYDGWQEHDSPRVLAAAGDLAVGERIAISGALVWGLRDPQVFEVHAGLVLQLPAFLPIAVDE